jgi:hypothetical protein
MARKLLLVILAFAAAATSGRAAIFTVGAGGTHATVQAAIDAALAAGGANEIRVAAGTRLETVRIEAAGAVSLALLGGYLPGFTSRSPAPVATTLDAEHREPPLTVHCTAGEVRVEGFALVRGFDRDTGLSGGGAEILASGTCAVGVTNVDLRDSRGGGAHLYAADAASIALAHAALLRNDGGSVERYAAGILIVTSGDGRIDLSDVDLRDHTRGQSTLAIFQHEGKVTLRQVSLQDNDTSSGVWGFLGRKCGPSATASVTEIRGLRVENTTGAGPVLSRPAAVSIDIGCKANLVLTDALLARGVDGLSVRVPRAAPWTSQLDFANLTVADFTGTGIVLDAPLSSVPPGVNAIHLANTIAFGNGVDLVVNDPGGDVVRLDHATNLVGVDPLFVASAAHDYRLRSSSPGIDHGTAMPAGGLGLTDVAGSRRISGAAPDSGAFERAAGSECAALPDTGLPNWLPICRCLSDPGHGFHRCGFFFPDFFAELRVPFPWIEDQPVTLDWLLHGWSGIESSFVLAPSLVVDGQEVALQTVKGLLSEGKLAAGQAFTTPPAGVVEVRSRLSYKRPDGQLVEVTFEASIPEPPPKP